MRRAAASRLHRWGLLLTTIALGTALVGTGLASYLVSRSASEAVVRARGLDLLLALRRRVVEAGGADAQALAELLSEMEEQGLRAVAVVDRDGRVLAAAGEPAGPIGPPSRLRPGEDGWPVTTRVGDRVRAVAPVWPGRGPGPWARGGRWQGGKGPPFPPGGPAEGRARRGLRDAFGAQGAFAVVELEPAVASTIASRAAATLAVSIATAFVLLAAAGILWRQSRRSDRLEAQLARDRELKALGEMSAVLGHEIRNPLAALKGHAQLLLERLGEEHPGRRGAETVVREAIRLESLTSQVLEFVRTGAIERAPADPLAVARAAAESGRDGLVRVSGEADLPPWPMDRERMERVLANLLSNALAASPPGEPVDLAVRLERGRTLVYEVRDRGPGIPPGDEEWIFEPFRTGKVKGTGLGLAVARRIVEAHGGELRVASPPDGGALFQVRLPGAAAEEV